MFPSMLMKRVHFTLIPRAGEARRGGLFLVENKQKHIPLPPWHSKLWSGVRMRDRDDVVDAFFISLPGCGFRCRGTARDRPRIGHLLARREAGGFVIFCLAVVYRAVGVVENVL
jgi:hypothetical protein